MNSSLSVVLNLLLITIYVIVSQEACPRGHVTRSSDDLCQACAVGTYKDSNVSCARCPNGTKTWGRQGVDGPGGCTATNPIKVRLTQINILPQTGPSEIIGVFYANYSNNSLVEPPLVYSIIGITKMTSSRFEDTKKENTLDAFNACNELGNLSHPFCIIKSNGSILTNNNFTCLEGDRFVLAVKVSDSANNSKGIIYNSNGSVIIKCTDPCRETHHLYTSTSALCSPCQPNSNSNYSYHNNESRHQIDISLPWPVYNLNAVYLRKALGSTFRSSCSLVLSYNLSNGITYYYKTRPEFSLGENETDKSIVLSKPLRSNNSMVSISMLCGNNSHGLSNISSVAVAISPVRDIKCTSINTTCLVSLYKWWTKAARLPDRCKQDPFYLLDCYGKCIESPVIQLTPRSIWRGKSGGIVNLTCSVESEMPYTIEWRRKGVTISTNKTLSIITNTTNQGYFTCQIENIYRKWPKTLLVVLSDYFTSYVTMKLKVKYLANKKSKVCADQCKLMATNLGNNFTTEPCLGIWNLNGYVGIKCVLYGKRRRPLDEYYESLVNEFQLRKNVQVIALQDAEVCLKETTGTSKAKGVFHWKTIKLCDKQTVHCPYGPDYVKVTRRCRGNFTTGASWDIFNDVNCITKETNAKVEPSLDKLNKTKVTSENAKEVAESLSAIFNKSSSKNLTENDVTVAANTLENIVSVTDKLNETGKLLVDVIDTIMDMDTAVLRQRRKDMSKIIKVVDKIAEHIPIEEGKTSKVLKAGNIVIQANEASKNTFKGLEFGMLKDASNDWTPGSGVALIKLPATILKHSNKDPSRIGCIYFANNKLFQSDLKSGTKLSTSIISSSVYDAKTSDLSEPVKVRMSRLQAKDGELLMNSSCVFWDEQGRKWLTDGCSLCGIQDGPKDSVLCCCDHMTSFAVLFSPEGPSETTHVKALSIITYVGCITSLIGVTLTFLTYLLFRHLRKTNQQPILMNICVAIGLLLVVFLVGVSNTDNPSCQIVAVLLHYLTLVTVLWMGIEAYNLYLQIVKVMAIYQRKFMMKAALVGWGVPLVVVLATLTAAIVQGNRDNRAIDFYYGNNQVCILHNRLYRLIGWFLPILIILILNCAMFIIVVRKLNSTGAMAPIDTKSALRKRVWTAFAILCLLGLTWLFGAFAISDARIVFEYLFCIFNSLQGFFIFFFHCVRIPEVRKQWSFFVSGLGFSHKNSLPSQHRSHGNVNHLSDANAKEPATPIEHAPRKITIQTSVHEQNQTEHVENKSSKADIELEDVKCETNIAMDETC